jgi:transcriptional regulator of met regulon
MTVTGYNFSFEKIFSRRIRRSKKTFRHLAGFALFCAVFFFNYTTIKH